MRKQETVTIIDKFKRQKTNVVPPKTSELPEDEEEKDSDISFGTAGNMSRSYSIDSLDHRNSEDGVSPLGLAKKETKISEMRRGKEQYNALSNMSHEESMDASLQNEGSVKVGAIGSLVHDDKKLKGAPKKKKRHHQLMESSSMGSHHDLELAQDSLPTIDSKYSKNVSQQKLNRMRYRKNKVKYLFYPEDSFKSHWDLLISLILIASSTITPLHIAFAGLEEPLGWQIFNYFIDVMFTLDIIIIFNAAYHDDEFKIVEDRK